MPYRLRTRIAPTPSGYLHVGNAWSFTLTWLLARAQGGTVRLRIDDLDAARFREEYLEDVFATLEWLGIDWDAGPRDAADFRASHSQRLRLERYREALEALRASGRLYACGCSRPEIRRATEAAGRFACPRGCGARDDARLDAAGREEAPGGAGIEETAWRFRMPDRASARDLAGGRFALHPARDVGDAILRQKNGDPAYHIASLADDADHGINVIVRGLDLAPSTGAQLAVAGALGISAFADARFWHHPLVLDDRGEKLSKSRDAESPVALRARLPDPGPLLRAFARALGMPEDAARSVRRVSDLLPGFDPARVPDAPLRADALRAERSGAFLH